MVGPSSFVPMFHPLQEVLRQEGMGNGVAGLMKGSQGSLSSVTSSIIKNFSTRVMGLMSTSLNNLLPPVINTLYLDVHGRRALL